MAARTAAVQATIGCTDIEDDALITRDACMATAPCLRARIVDDCAYTAEQIGEWEGNHYDLTLRLTAQCGAQSPVVHEFRSRYYAVEIPTLERLLADAGFVSVARRDEQFFQPLLVAVNAPAR